MGRAIPFFRDGTDYILNLLVTGSSAYYADRSFACFTSMMLHPSTTILAAYKSIHGC
ncbi:hypothetical protein ACFFHF_18325 [Robertmurraya beringensis]|uniref:Uncharacterized protein n=1 Tax=Robertmurraya beringensis TaxID=641660 RepID=A0ABV6KV08_9BACI